MNMTVSNARADIGLPKLEASVPAKTSKVSETAKSRIGQGEWCGTLPCRRMPPFTQEKNYHQELHQIFHQRIDDLLDHLGLALRRGPVECPGCEPVLPTPMPPYPQPIPPSPTAVPTSIQKAILKGNNTMLRSLLEAGADVNGIDDQGDSAIFYALRSNSLEMFKTLIEFGADLNTFDHHGESAVSMVFTQGNQWLEAAKASDVPMNLNIRGHGGFYPIHSVTNGYFPFGTNNDHLEFVLHGGININAQTSQGLTAAMFSLINQDLDTAETLKNHGADFSIPTDEGFTPLMEAVWQDHGLVFIPLPDPILMPGPGIPTPVPQPHPKPGPATPISFPEPLPKPGPSIPTPVSQPVNPHSPKIEAASDEITPIDSFGVEPAICPMPPMLGAEYTKFVLSCEGVDVNARTDSGRTALMECVFANSYEAAKVLIEHNADVNQKDNSGRTALDYAIARNLTSLAQLLLDAGSYIDQR